MSSISLRTISMRFWRSSKRTVLAQQSRTYSIICRGTAISREELFRYTTGRFLTKEAHECQRRYVEFDLDKLCEIASNVGGQESPICTIEKLEGGFSKALLLHKEDGSEIIAKIPFPIAGPPKYTTASEVAVLKYLHKHTQVPVPRVLAWNSDASNPVGSEYIMMEKASGSQLFHKWGDMSDYDQFTLVKLLSKLEGDMINIKFPASGSLYLRESMAKNDRYEALDYDMDPNGEFCIGPSCERGWYTIGEPSSLQDKFNRGPWPNLASFGCALVDRELARLENRAESPKTTSGSSVEEQCAVLKIARDVFSRMNSSITLMEKLSQPTLWHTDLHMGNIFVADDNPTQIVSIIDWQSIVVAPLYLQARFPEFLPIDDNYKIGTEMVKLPENYEQMDADDKEIADFQFKYSKLAKAYEISLGIRNRPAHNALSLPSFLDELFIRSAEASEDGVVALRDCLIQLSEAWNQVGFTGDCPFSFSAEDLQKHEHEFEEYSNTRKVQELARELLSTNSEGWISPQLDFDLKKKQNDDLLGLIMSRSADYHKTPEQIRQIWPFVDV